ncbi:MAG: molybdopterin-dependent oxidoreductase [Deltaproteobacteria bacterium]|nr:molybdopterin-dependent oxidoreductase [Deltaproteobacteria bacterium]
MRTEPRIEKVRGYCVLCTAHCATVATVEDGRVTRLDPDHDHPNGGAICVKGKAAPELVYNGERLDYPLRRTKPKGAEDPGWERVSWDEALDDIATRLLSIRERYGAEAIAMARGTASGTSVDDVNQWSTRLLNRIGSPNSLSTTHVCNWHKDTVFSYTFGVPQPSPDVLHSGAFLLWGHNPSSTQLMLATDVVTARKRGMKIVVVDPRRVGLGSQADVLLQVRPGADGALALALVHVMIEEGRYDEAFVRDWTNGPFLLRTDTGEPLTEAEVAAGGSPDRYLVWDEASNRAVVYDPRVKAFEADGFRPMAATGPAPSDRSGAGNAAGVRPAILGSFAVPTKDGGTISCEPAFAALARLASTHAPERSESVTLVPADKVREAARVLGDNRPVSMFMWNGVGQHTNASQTSRAISILYALLGDIDAPGGNLMLPMAPFRGVDGKEFLPAEAAARRIGRDEKPLGPPATVGACAAHDVYTAILEDRPYPVRALINLGSNTVLSNGDPGRGREALCALELGVATELFMTPTAQLCDYVLPATSFLEMEHLCGGFRHRVDARTHVQYRPKAVEPLAERRSDTWVIFELAMRMGFGDDFWGGDVEAAFAYQLEPTGMTLDELKSHAGGVTLESPRRYRKYADADGEGHPKGFNNPSGRVEIYSHRMARHGFPPLPEYHEPAVSPASRPDVAAEYPLVLTNAKFTTFVHSQHRTLPSLRKAAPEPTAELHPDTAGEHGVEHKQWMVVESPKGAVKVRANLTARIIPGVVCLQHGWWQPCRELELPGHDPFSGIGANPNGLVDAEHRDPISGSLPHRSSLCRVRPAVDA